KSAAVVVPAACRRRSHAGKPRASRVLFRHRVDYRTVPATVGHGCTMDADSGAADHAARSGCGRKLAATGRRGTIAAHGFRISEIGVLSRRLAAACGRELAIAAGTTPAAPTRGPRFVLHGDRLRFRPVSDATTVAARPDLVAPTARCS